MKTEQVVIIGASISGLSAARVLAPYFKKVTLIERDTLDEQALHRLGAPQSQHQHALLARTRQGFDALFPGFSERLLAGGAHLLNPGLDFAFFGPNGWMTRQPGVEALFQSRSLTERVLREMAVSSIPNLQIRTGLEVAGFVASKQADGRTRINGVKLVDASGAAQVLEADLVVDASGRASQTLRWFDAIGLGKPDETTVDAFCGYSSRWYQAPASLPEGWWWKAAYCGAKPGAPMGASIAPVEGGRWLVTAWGYEKQYPPTDEAGFDSFLQHGLRNPLIHKMTELAEPISPVYSFRGFVNRRRWFSRWAQLPKGYVTVGDVGCVFNPVHGQGMASAVMAAQCLGDVIGRIGLDDPEFERSYFKAAETMQETPAVLSCGYDLRFPSAQGERPAFFEAKNRFFDHLADATQKDNGLYLQLMRVMHLLDTPAALSQPSVIAKTGAQMVRALLGGTPPRDMSATPPLDFRSPAIKIPGGRAKPAPSAAKTTVSAEAGWQLARVIGKREEATGIFSLELVAADDQPLPAFEAGAHLEVKLGGHIRQYSLCGNPQDTQRWMLGVQAEPAGRGGSQAICALQVGDQLLWRGPRQLFPLHASAAPTLLIAGGIGITPLLAMAEQLHHEGRPFELHVCTRSLARTPFRGRMAAAPFSKSVHLHLDDGDAAQKFNVSALLAGGDRARHVYVCGPGAFIDWVVSQASEQGWAPEQVHVERFTAEAISDERPNLPFKLELRRSGRVVDVPADCSALSALNAAGCNIPVSCETGVCGTCETPVLEGEPDHRDSFLTPAAKRSGTVFLPCRSRALSDTLVLDI